MRLLLIISGSIAAYKSLELIRRAREAGHIVTPVLTAGGAEFITPLAVAALAETHCYTDLFSLKDETEMGHIRLSREADAVLVAPASADLLAKMAHGRADDLASSVLLATDKPVFVAPAMNPAMWAHPATQRHLAQLAADGVHLIQPDSGETACGEEGQGRMAEPHAILHALTQHAPAAALPLRGLHALVTAGPTQEPVDPVRYLTNRSSGKQGYAIARALAAAGARVTLVSGPTALACPLGVEHVAVRSAEEMLKATEAALPADIAVCTAAVADWKVDRVSAQKMKKTGESDLLTLRLIENPDILYAIAHHATHRPALVIGFAAETEALLQHAQAKKARKGCDWLLANDVSGDVFGSDHNRITLLSDQPVEHWPDMRKDAIATRLAERIAAHWHTHFTPTKQEAAHG